MLNCLFTLRLIFSSSSPYCCPLATMASSNAVDIAPVEGDAAATKENRLHKDVEVGPETIDIDRIERVYA